MLTTLVLSIVAAVTVPVDRARCECAETLQAPGLTPAEVAHSLLAADRAFAAAGATRDMRSAMTPMFANGVMMPRPTGGFAVGKADVLAALLASPGASASRVTWQPVRAGVSADGMHGFTFGYMMQQSADGIRVPFKYLAYWVRDAGVWRVMAYRRGRAPGPASDTAMMAPALPARLVAAGGEVAALTRIRRDLMNAENSFSARAQAVGLGRAFAEFGSSDAVNMGGPQSVQFVVSAANIAQHVGGTDQTASPVTWSADTAIVASSGDLGVTFGIIRPKNPAPGSAPGAGTPFFTIWRRASPTAPWRYIAE